MKTIKDISIKVISTIRVRDWKVTNKQYDAIARIFNKGGEVNGDIDEEDNCIVELFSDLDLKDPTDFKYKIEDFE